MAPLTWRGTWSVLSRPRSNRRYTALILPVVIAALVAVPLLLLLGELLTPSVEVWEQLWATTLPRMIGNTLFLLVAVGLGTSTIGEHHRGFTGMAGDRL